MMITHTLLSGIAAAPLTYAVPAFGVTQTSTKLESCAALKAHSTTCVYVC
jgi:hypothetical protein